MKRIFTTIAAVCIASAGVFAQKTNTTYLEMFTGAATENWWGFVYPSPSPSFPYGSGGFSPANDAGTYATTGDALYCTINGTFVTLTGIAKTWDKEVNTPGVANATTGFLTFTGGTDSKSLFDNSDFTLLQKEMGYFVGNPIIDAGATSSTITGTFVVKTLTGCRNSYKLDVANSVNQLSFVAGTQVATVVSSVDPTYTLDGSFIAQNWLNLGLRGPFWEQSSNVLGVSHVDVTANRYVLMAVDAGTMSGVLFQVVSEEKGIGTNQSFSVRTLTSGLNAIVHSVTASNLVYNVRIRTANAFGTIKIKSFAVGFAPTTSISLTGITELSPGVVAKETEFNVGFSSTPSFNGFGNFTYNDPSGILAYSNVVNTTTGIPAIKISLIDYGTVTLVGSSIDNPNLKVTKVISAVLFITSSTIAGSATLAVGATKTFSITGITPSNAQAPTSTVWISSTPTVATMNATTGVLTGVAAGVTTVTAKHILSNNTTITSGAVVVTINTVGTLDALSTSEFSIAPNPTEDAVSVSSAVAVSGLKVYSLTGTEVAASGSSSVSLSGLASGVYILEVSTAQGSVFKRVIKK